MKILSLVPVFALVLTSTLALADDSRAGTAGHVTAFELDGKTVIDVDPCARLGKTHDYATCGRAFRPKVNATVCREKGAGRHKWIYQVGNNTHTRSQKTAVCE